MRSGSLVSARAVSPRASVALTSATGSKGGDSISWDRESGIAAHVCLTRCMRRPPLSGIAPRGHRARIGCQKQPADPAWQDYYRAATDGSQFCHQSSLAFHKAVPPVVIEASHPIFHEEKNDRDDERTRRRPSLGPAERNLHRPACSPRRRHSTLRPAAGTCGWWQTSCRRCIKIHGPIFTAVLAVSRYIVNIAI